MLQSRTGLIARVLERVPVKDSRLWQRVIVALVKALKHLTPKHALKFKIDLRVRCEYESDATEAGTRRHLKFDLEGTTKLD